MEFERKDGLELPLNVPSIVVIQELLHNLIDQAEQNDQFPPSFIKIKGEKRPYVNLTILQQTFPALPDSGASRNICGGPGCKRLISLGFKYRKISESHEPVVSTADNTLHSIRHIFSIPVHFDRMFAIIQVLSAPTLPDDLVMGIPFMNSFQMGMFTPYSTWIPEDVPEFDITQPSEHVNSLSINADSHNYEIENIPECQRDLTLEQKSILQPIIDEFEKLGKILLGRTNAITHDIDTGDNPPCFTRTRPTSPAKEQKIEQEFLRFKSLGVIEPAQTAFRNAMTMVERYKSGKLKLRLCMDSRKLNAITKVEKYDLPRITTILSRLGTARFMSKIDLKDAYLQIPLTERSKEKTAFFIKGHGVCLLLPID